jgi:hypothetical protein
MRKYLFVIALLLIATGGAHAQQCTPNHELYRIVPKYRAVMLDGGEIKRVMFVDEKDERLSTWKPGHNITFCPDQNKMINTTINSIATLVSEFNTTCEPLLISNDIDRSLQHAWDDTNNQQAYPRSVFHPEWFVAEAKRQLGWYYEICTDHQKGADLFEKDDFKSFLISAESLTRINMAYEDRSPVNESTYKERAAKYKRWQEALWAAEGKKSWFERVWQGVTH